MTEDKRARFDEIKYKRGGYAPMEGDNIGPTIDWLIARLEAAWEKEERLEEALRRLEGAADVYDADQTGAEDDRCGFVQPISVAEGIELNAALQQARAALGEKP